MRLARAIGHTHRAVGLGFVAVLGEHRAIGIVRVKLDAGRCGQLHEQRLCRRVGFNPAIAALDLAKREDIAGAIRHVSFDFHDRQLVIGVQLRFRRSGDQQIASLIFLLDFSNCG